MRSTDFKSLVASFPGRKYADGGVVPDDFNPMDPKGDPQNSKNAAKEQVRLDYLKQKYVDPIAAAIKAPHDAYTGELQTIDPETGMPSNDAMAAGLNMAGLASTGAAPSLIGAGFDPSHVGMFVGQTSKKFPARESQRFS
jgi:hypothetical protein